MRLAARKMGRIKTKAKFAKLLDRYRKKRGERGLEAGG